MLHFEQQLPDYIKLTVNTTGLVSKITLVGIKSAKELLRFKINRLHLALTHIFDEELISTDGKNLSETLGNLLAERELTVSCAESCTGGNIAHRITQIPGSSAYFLGSVVSYSNDVKANVLGVSRQNLDKFGAVSRQVAEDMVRGIASLMRTDCSLATTGIAGPGGGTKFKPVGTVWIAVKYKDRVVSECKHFNGNREEVIDASTNHAMVMLVRLMRNNYQAQEDISDD